MVRHMAVHYLCSLLVQQSIMSRSKFKPLGIEERNAALSKVTGMLESPNPESYPEALAFCTSN